jgi:hypothetical protein
MIYELRVYRAAPGRMPEVLDRFEKVVFRYWAKYGIQAVGFWTTVIGECHLDLHQMLVWESLAERERKWTAFSTDPEFRTELAATETNGALVASVSNTILAPTRFSAMQ